MLQRSGIEIELLSVDELDDVAFLEAELLEERAFFEVEELDAGVTPVRAAEDLALGLLQLREQVGFALHVIQRLLVDLAVVVLDRLSRQAPDVVELRQLVDDLL